MHWLRMLVIKPITSTSSELQKRGQFCRRPPKYWGRKVDKLTSGSLASDRSRLNCLVATMWAHAGYRTLGPRLPIYHSGISALTPGT